MGTVAENRGILYICSQAARTAIMAAPFTEISALIKLSLFKQRANLILNMRDIEFPKVMLYFVNLVRQCLPSFTSIRSTAHTIRDLTFATPAL